MNTNTTGRRFGRTAARALACAVIVSGAGLLGAGVANADTPMIVYDLDGDGRYDSVAGDFNKDGYYEAWLLWKPSGCEFQVDTNLDGTVDTFYYDTNCDGVIDVFPDLSRSNLTPDMQSSMMGYGNFVWRGIGQYGPGI